MTASHAYKGYDTTNVETSRRMLWQHLIAAHGQRPIDPDKHGLTFYRLTLNHRELHLGIKARSF